MILFTKRPLTEAEVIEDLVDKQNVTVCRAYLQLFLDGETVEQMQLLKALSVVLIDLERGRS
jgi:hypothetical protein